MRLCELISQTRFGFDQKQWLSLALMNVSSIALLSLFDFHASKNMFDTSVHVCYIVSCSISLAPCPCRWITELCAYICYKLSCDISLAPNPFRWITELKYCNCAPLKAFQAWQKDF